MLARIDTVASLQCDPADGGRETLGRALAEEVRTVERELEKL